MSPAFPKTPSIPISGKMVEKPGAGRRASQRAFAALLLIALLCALCPSRTQSAEETEYIVKLRGPSDAPFTVVGEGEMRRLMRSGRLEWAEPDGEAILLGPEAEVELQGTLSPYYADEQWNLDMIGADAAFRQGFLGQGIRVGVLDSGVNPHPAFGDRLLAGHNYVQDAEDTEDTSDVYGHGTRIAGLIAGRTEEGYIGTAPQALIVPLKVTDGKTVKLSTLCEAIYGAVDEYGCQVLNLSLGVRNDHKALQEAVAYAETKGVVVISAVGNNGSRTLYYPAGYDTVIGVGAVDCNSVLYYHSDHNESVFLTAPGVDVRSTASRGGFTSSTGTSFAVPQVAGAAAVLLGIDGSLTPAAIRALLADTASDIGDEGYDEFFGYGLLNLGGCVTLLTEGKVSPRESCSFLPETGPAAAIRNNTDGELDCTYLLAEYDEAGVCLGVKTRRFTLPAGGTAELAVPDEGTNYGQFIYETNTLRPLTEARKLH